MKQFSEGRYRWRTKMRMRLPGFLGWMFPKGQESCGHHDLYTVSRSPGGSAKIMACYHCIYETVVTTTVSAERQRHRSSHV